MVTNLTPNESNLFYNFLFIEKVTARLWAVMAEITRIKLASGVIHIWTRRGLKISSLQLYSADLEIFF